MSLATLETRLLRLEAVTWDRHAAADFSGDPVGLAAAGGFHADDWQRDLLRSEASQLLLNCSRQSGKSSVCAWLAVWTAIYQAPALVIACSPSQRQSHELFLRIRRAYTAVRAFAPPLVEETALSLTTSTGSRLLCLPGKEQTIRGFSEAALILIDEAARVADDLVAALRPMLAVSGGRLALLSTPFGRRGAFFEAWANGGADWQRFEIPANRCKRIDPAWLAAEKEQIGEWWWNQEFACQFVDRIDSVFSFEHVQAAVSPDVRPLFFREAA